METTSDIAKYIKEKYNLREVFASRGLKAESATDMNTNFVLNMMCYTHKPYATSINLVLNIKGEIINVLNHFNSNDNLNELLGKRVDLSTIYITKVLDDIQVWGHIIDGRLIFENPYCILPLRDTIPWVNNPQSKQNEYEIESAYNRKNTKETALFNQVYQDFSNDLISINHTSEHGESWTATYSNKGNKVILKLTRFFNYILEVNLVKKIDSENIYFQFTTKNTGHKRLIRNISLFLEAGELTEYAKAAFIVRDTIPSTDRDYKYEHIDEGVFKFKKYYSVEDPVSRPYEFIVDLYDQKVKAVPRSRMSKKFILDQEVPRMQKRFSIINRI